MASNMAAFERFAVSPEIVVQRQEVFRQLAQRFGSNWFGDLHSTDRRRLQDQVDFALFQRQNDDVSSFSLDDFVAWKLNPIVREFDQYDFDKDERFQAGLDKVRAKLQPDQDVEVELLRTRVFYFSRFFKPIDWTDYETYVLKKTPSKLNADILNAVAEAVTVVSASALTLQAESSTGVAAVQPASVTEAPKYPKTFSEVFEMIQRGETLPGVREIPNVINTLPPSQPTMTPRPKPWENSINNQATVSQTL